MRPSGMSQHHEIQGHVACCSGPDCSPQRLTSVGHIRHDQSQIKIAGRRGITPGPRTKDQHTLCPGSTSRRFCQLQYLSVHGYEICLISSRGQCRSLTIFPLFDSVGSQLRAFRPPLAAPTCQAILSRRSRTKAEALATAEASCEGGSACRVLRSPMAPPSAGKLR